jgi:hypothetical protein
MPPAAPMLMLCWACAAAFQLLSPAWLALIMQVPTAVKVSVPPASTQPLLPAASDTVGVNPELATALTL